MAKRRGGRRHRSSKNKKTFLPSGEADSPAASNGLDEEEEEGDEGGGGLHEGDEDLEEGESFSPSSKREVHGEQAETEDEEEEEAQAGGGGARAGLQKPRSSFPAKETEKHSSLARDTRRHGAKRRSPSDSLFSGGGEEEAKEDFSSSEHKKTKRKEGPPPQSKKDKVGMPTAAPSSSSSPDGKMGGYSEYFAHVKQVIEEKAFQSDEDWVLFITATAEEIASKVRDRRKKVF